MMPRFYLSIVRTDTDTFIGGFVTQAKDEQSAVDAASLAISSTSHRDAECEIVVVPMADDHSVADGMMNRLLSRREVASLDPDGIAIVGDGTKVYA